MRRRSNGEGSFQKLPSGNWRVQIMDGHKPDGRKNILTFTAPTKGEVQQKVRQYFAAKETGQYVQTRKTPFDQWADTWYAGYKDQVQPSTYANYQYTLKLLKAHFGSRPIQDIQLIHIDGFLSGLGKTGYSVSLITKCKAMLIQIFAYAEDNNLIPKNPALRARVAKDCELEAPGRKDAFSTEEEAALMAELPDDLLGNSIRTLLVTGLRVQELLALTPDDIAEDGSSIRVSKAIKMVGGVPVLGPPKSKTSNRVIPVPTDYRSVVRRLRAQGGKAFLWSSTRSDLLFNVKRFRQLYYRALDQIPDVRRLSPHCCRHTYVTRLEANGVPLQLIAHLAGHSSTGTTVGYTHTDLNTLAQAVSALNKNNRDPMIHAAS